jgi:hypothetical protein
VGAAVALAQFCFSKLHDARRAALVGDDGGGRAAAREQAVRGEVRHAALHLGDDRLVLLLVVLFFVLSRVVLGVGK